MLNTSRNVIAFNSVEPILFDMTGFTHICGKTVLSATLMAVKNLQSADSRSVENTNI